ncbi:PilZ domain-containing protein [Blastococcus sp. SYSU D00669]
MISEPGVDHPEEQTKAEVTLTSRGVSVSTRVEMVSGGVLTVRPSVSEFVDEAVVVPGDAVEVFWIADEETRALPAEVVDVEQGAAVRWRLRTTGPAGVSQRRKAVRARLTLPAGVGFSSVEIVGESVDLSEAGLRVTAEGFGAPPENGDQVDLVLEMEDAPLRTRAEVVRLQARGTRWLLSLRFVGLPEREGDRVRRRVFQALREERAKRPD